MNFRLLSSRPSCPTVDLEVPGPTLCHSLKSGHTLTVDTHTQNRSCFKTSLSPEDTPFFNLTFELLHDAVVKNKTEFNDTTVKEHFCIPKIDSKEKLK